MTAELTVLALSGVLLLVHVFAATHYKTKQYGVEWNMGARDEDTEPLNDIAGRLDRARGNFLETLPLAIIALLGVVVAGKASDLTAIAAWVWLAARVIYLPLYWAGIPKIRTYVWGVGLLALLFVLGVLLIG
ncbi:MAPEG family protein [Aurantiacibacter odishensis]|uniref:MAPEG family protein n=1 Tax=Aurantiacibacter odishensis TaxID=1155476 RepID=UPI000E764D42|nr:MAPEG family protein [Aurantiacibacter odishensis]